MTDTQGKSDPPKPAHDAVAGAFDLLTRGVQRQLWRMGWTELRPIQVEAIHTIVQSQTDCVIAAETASGKTEAAFLPILSEISSEPGGSIRAMYVGPLRALINDQFRRLEELCTYLEMPTHRWHGDVSATGKAKLVKDPGGVLLITPESLESLFVNRSPHLARLFGGLRFVVIDELHSFQGSERGIHLRSLLARLRRVMAPGGGPVRTIGLSATIGDLRAAQRYVNRALPETVVLIEDRGEGKELKYRLHAYVSEPDANDEDDADESTMRQIADDLVEHCRASSNLIFANAKSDIELYADYCNETARRQGLPASFLVHHASLSREIREDTEALMKDRPGMTAVCSATLELGIDIGAVRLVGQIGAPWSVASLKQRLGRSGRKDGEPRIMRVYIGCQRPDPAADFLNRLHLELVQAIATTELLLQGWVEPSTSAKCDLSTLAQQIISVIAETGGLPAAMLYDRLVTHGAFEHVEAALFKKVLQSLGEQDVIEQMATGDLILGLVGEKIRSGRDFYAAFQTPAEYAVTTGDRLIGTLPILGVPAPEDHLLLGGRRWKVVQVDTERSEILVQPARGRKPPLFYGSGGAVHRKIREQMREVLRSDQTYSYLNATAAELLADARHASRQAHALNEPLLSLSRDRTLWLTWSGTRTQATLVAMLALRGVQATDRGVAIQVEASHADTLAAVRRVIRKTPGPEDIATAVQPKLRRKYDYLLTQELLNKVIARDVLDCPTAVSACRALLDAL